MTCLFAAGITAGALGIFGMLWSTRGSKKHARRSDQESQGSNSPIGVLLVIGSFAIMALFALSRQHHDRTATRSRSITAPREPDKPKEKGAWSTVRATFESTNATVGKWKL